MAKHKNKGGVNSAPLHIYKYVGPECNALLLPNNKRVVPTELTSEEITALIQLFPALLEYWILVSDDDTNNEEI